MAATITAMAERPPPKRGTTANPRNRYERLHVELDPLAVSFDEEAPQVVTLVPPDYVAQNSNRNWEKAVSENARYVRTTHPLGGAGYHTLKIWMIDPGVVLEKVIVDCGGVRPSFFGPPESRYMAGTRVGGRRK